MQTSSSLDAGCVFPAVIHGVKRITVEYKLSCSIGGGRDTLYMVLECVGCNQNNFTRVCLSNTETSVIFEVRGLNLSLKAPKHVEARSNTDRSHSPWTRIQQPSAFKLPLRNTLTHSMMEIYAPCLGCHHYAPWLITCDWCNCRRSLGFNCH